MKTIYISLLMVLLNSHVEAQKAIPVYFDFCNYYWRQPVLNRFSDIEVLYNDTVCNLRVYMTDWKGALTFSLKSKDGRSLLDGQCINSLAILRNYIAVRTNGINSNTKLTIINFYRPLRNGTWIYYKGSSMEKTEQYLNGVITEDRESDFP